MPKGRGANARRRTARQRGHLADDDRAEAAAERGARAWARLERLYAPSTERARQRQAAARAEAGAKRAARTWV